VGCGWKGGAGCQKCFCCCVMGRGSVLVVNGVLLSVNPSHARADPLLNVTTGSPLPIEPPLASNPLQPNPLQTTPTQTKPIQSNPNQSNPIQQLGYSDKATKRLMELTRAYKHTLGEDEVGGLYDGSAVLVGVGGANDPSELP